MIEIWHPRYHDNTVLIAAYKVMAGMNEVRFLKAKSLEGMRFMVRGEEVAKCPKEYIRSKNGRDVAFYVVPMEKLQRI